MIRLLRDQILAERCSLKYDSKGGIIIPELCQQPSYEGIVVAKGPKVHDVNIGDHILWKRNYGVPYEHEGKDYMLFCEDQIEAIFEPEGSG